MGSKDDKMMKIDRLRGIRRAREFRRRTSMISMMNLSAGPNCLSLKWQSAML